MALEQAAKGRRTAVICSGDAGVYGMAGLVLELGKGYPNVEIEVVSGITAAFDMYKLNKTVQKRQKNWALEWFFAEISMISAVL